MKDMAGHTGFSKKAVMLLVLLTCLVMITVYVRLAVGYIPFDPYTATKVWLGMGTDKQKLILLDLTMPRICLSILIGMGLAVSGAVLQGLSGNVLADPGILGINSGAGLAVILFVSMYPATKPGSVLVMPLTALVGALLTAAIIYLFSHESHNGISPSRLLLVGVSVGAGIGALMIVLSLKLNHQNYQMIVNWLAGSIGGANWTFVTALLPWMVILLPFSFCKARVLDILALGDAQATGLGISVQREKRWLLLTAVGLAGSCVSVSGGIGFVGLVAPHLARFIMGPEHRYVLPMSALLGGLLVLSADTIATTLLQPKEIPTGVVIAFVGAPYFMYLLAKSKM